MSRCFLCGCLPAKGCRQLTNDLKAFTQMNCQPTPFAYDFIMQSETEEEHATLCIPCLNWKRRTMRRSRKVYLQIDQMICYILQPGRMNEPDQRCVQRLLKALADDGNPLSSSAPMPVKTIVANLAAHDLYSIGLAWWEYNRKTPFFRHPQTARIVRSIVKEEPEA